MRATGRLPALIPLLFVSAVAAADEIELKAPVEAGVGAEIEVSFSGAGEERDFISVDDAGAPEREYGPYKYVKGGSPVRVRVPDAPGSYSVRYHRSSAGYPVATARALTVKDASAQVGVPAEVDAGSTFEVTFSGPSTQGDFVAVDRAGAPDREYGPYVYVNKGSPAQLRAPDAAGEYQVRYHLGQSYRVLAAVPLHIGGTTATLQAAESVAAGAEVTVAWTGPNDASDFISVDRGGAPDREYGTYAYTKDGSTLVLRAPDEPGEYALRYHTGQTYAVLGERALRVVPAAASVDGPQQVEARAVFAVTWKGPDNPQDYVAIAVPSEPGQKTESYAYTMRGTPARLQAPQKEGAYELRYVTGQSNIVLARAAIQVAPGKAPGTLRVTGSGKEASFGAVELILDASGSMLQRIDGKRRIDLAKAALSELTSETLPPGTPFALRIFGHREADSCRTDLEIPLAPLQRAQALAKIRGIEAKNLAKTPIADSLRRVAEDLAGVRGTAVVVLVTDGEETCDGDPATELKTLRAKGFDVRVQIVGFAIDEVALKEQFEKWADLGGGSYFDAADGATLARSFRAALRVPFQVKKDGATVASGVVDGDPVELPPGTYEVLLRSAPPRTLGTVSVAAEKESRLEM